LRKRFRMFGADASLRCAVPVSLSHSSQGRPGLDPIPRTGIGLILKH
jgi:hypothetical protein